MGTVETFLGKPGFTLCVGPQLRAVARSTSTKVLFKSYLT